LLSSLVLLEPLYEMQKEIVVQNDRFAFPGVVIAPEDSLTVGDVAPRHVETLRRAVARMETERDPNLCMVHRHTPFSLIQETRCYPAAPYLRNHVEVLDFGNAVRPKVRVGGAPEDARVAREFVIDARDQDGAQPTLVFCEQKLEVRERTFPIRSHEGRVEASRVVLGQFIDF